MAMTFKEMPDIIKALKGIFEQLVTGWLREPVLPRI